MSNKTHRSKTDPDAKLARKGEGGAKLAHGVNYLMDNKHQIISSGPALRRAAEFRRYAKINKNIEDVT